MYLSIAALFSHSHVVQDRLMLPVLYPSPLFFIASFILRIAYGDCTPDTVPITPATLVDTLMYTRKKTDRRALVSLSGALTPKPRLIAMDLMFCTTLVTYALIFTFQHLGK